DSGTSAPHPALKGWAIIATPLRRSGVYSPVFLSVPLCPLWLSLFRTFIKRRRHNLRRQALTAHFHSHETAGSRKFHGCVGSGDVCGHERRIGTAGNVAELVACVVQDLVSVTRNAALHHLQSSQRALYALRLRLFQGSSPDKVGLV